MESGLGSRSVEISLALSSLVSGDHSKCTGAHGGCNPSESLQPDYLSFRKADSGNSQLRVRDAPLPPASVLDGVQPYRAGNDCLPLPRKLRRVGEGP